MKKKKFGTYKTEYSLLKNLESKVRSSKKTPALHNVLQFHHSGKSCKN